MFEQKINCASTPAKDYIVVSDKMWVQYGKPTEKISITLSSNGHNTVENRTLRFDLNRETAEELMVILGYWIDVYDKA